MTTLHPEGSFNGVYHELLENIYLDGHEETNQRTKHKIKALRGGASFKLDLEATGRLPVAGNRRYYPHLAAAETAWQFLGTKDPAFIMKYAPNMWGNFVEDGELKSAYGYRWRKHFGRDQVAKALSQLWSDPSNRQLYISAWDPSADGLGDPGPKNVPCPVGFSVSMLDERLHLSVFIRSSDVVMGLPYDVMAYALILDAMARHVHAKTGTLHVTLAHPHVYETHYDIVEQSLNGPRWLQPWEVEPTLPAWQTGSIQAAPHRYVELVKESVLWLEKHPYVPRPELVV